MIGSKKTLAVPILVIALGTGWLLTTCNIVPGVNWIWVVGLGVTGVLILAASIDKVTAVVGPFLMAATIFSLLRRTGRMSVDTESALVGHCFWRTDVVGQAPPDSSSGMDERAAQVETADRMQLRTILSRREGGFNHATAGGTPRWACSRAARPPAAIKRPESRAAAARMISETCGRNRHATQHDCPVLKDRCNPLDTQRKRTHGTLP